MFFAGSVEQHKFYTHKNKFPTFLHQDKTQKHTKIQKNENTKMCTKSIKVPQTQFSSESY